MLEKIKLISQRIKSIPKEKKIKVISHFDTDGITAAAIFSKALQRLKKKFSLQIIKNLEEKFITEINDDSVLIFLDLASNSLDYLKNKKNEIIILDHHEITQEIPSNVSIANPHINNDEPISAAGIAYLCAKAISRENIDLATLAVIGMVGDTLDQNITKTYNEIIKDSGAIVKKGPLIYPSTRPLNRSLEYSTSPYIPNVTGNFKGVIELLKEANIPRENGDYKALYELTEEEMANLTTTILLRSTGKIDTSNLIGNIYLVKHQNKLEDARELSALINACSRTGRTDVSLGFCLGNKKFKEEAEKIYREHKQNLIAALKYINEAEKITGRKYTIINAKNKIKDTLIGTTASIISRSPLFEEGTIIIALAYNENKIKVSARIAGRVGRNVREILSKAIIPIGGEVGGHPNAAGCLIEKEKEYQFIEELKKVLDIELIKI